MKSICLWVAILALFHGVTLAIDDQQTPLSLARIKEIFYDLQDEVKKDALPIGFIYTQYPKEKAPADIWPRMNWTDVTSEYEGVFFRAAGGGAHTFGSIQEENVPAIDKVEAQGCNYDSNGKCHYYVANRLYSYYDSVSLPMTTGWSDYVGTNTIWLDAISSSGNKYAQVIHRYHTTAGEVRPRNMAIKVWKRSA